MSPLVAFDQNIEDTCSDNNEHYYHVHLLPPFANVMSYSFCASSIYLENWSIPIAVGELLSLFWFCSEETTICINYDCFFFVCI